VVGAGTGKPCDEEEVREWVYIFGQDLGPPVYLVWVRVLDADATGAAVHGEPGGLRVRFTPGTIPTKLQLG
jgi:hypothetical protein